MSSLSWPPPSGPSVARPPKLLDQVRQAIRLRHYSPRTEESYVGWIRGFILFHGKRHPRDLTEVAPLTRHLERVRRVHTRDLACGFGRVVLPEAIVRKYPTAAVQWGWQFVFPAARMCRDPRWGPPSRYHQHESVVQRAVAKAVRRGSA